MKLSTTLPVLALAIALPVAARAQDAKKVTCADHTIVASDSACASHGGVQKPGGLHRAGREINKAAIDTKHEVERTPKNVGKAGKKVRHGAGEAAGDVSDAAQKTVAPTQYYAMCKDGSKWVGRTRRGACKNKGGVADWTDSAYVKLEPRR